MEEASKQLVCQVGGVRLDVHIADLNTPIAEPDAEATCLSMEEKEKYASYLNPRRKSEFLKSRYIIKRLFFGQDCGDLKNYTLKYCKVNKFSAIFDCFGNIAAKVAFSHSVNYLVFIFYQTPKFLGVDIEVFKSRKSLSDIRDEVFSDEDKDKLAECKLSVEKFYQFWTEKEAVAKLTAIPLIQICKVSSETLHEEYNISNFLTHDYALSVAIDREQH
ncbi:4'-phosphopantetheinyl transferase family protein [Alteromonas macleodii]|uniref:4'-phosphopantetheinyl transferase domain-containing protein n=1 Tax=Alteromonas macleodii TaxID=28108 RepID=A0A6T9Y268_ALTMA|nr:4'-phosphopantetheinyl transferase superfamily protein [Alteromonas macleodii]CAB9495193.1 protein of unknown function [Alteromonas macleodii]